MRHYTDVQESGVGFCDLIMREVRQAASIFSIFCPLNKGPTGAGFVLCGAQLRGHSGFADRGGSG